MLFSHLRPSSGECGDCRVMIPEPSGGAKAAGLLPLFGELVPDNARPSLGVALREQHRLGQLPAPEGGAPSCCGDVSPLHACLAGRLLHGGSHDGPHDDEGMCLSS